MASDYIAPPHMPPHTKSQRCPDCEAWRAKNRAIADAKEQDRQRRAKLPHAYVPHPANRCCLCWQTEDHPVHTGLGGGPRKKWRSPGT